MDFGLTGKAHLSFNNITIIGTLGNNIHVHIIPDDVDFRNSYIDETLGVKVTLTERTLAISGTRLITVEYEPRTKLLSILNTNIPDFKKLAANAKTDPKAQAAVDHINGVLNVMPENGHVDRLLTFISSTRWFDLFAELINSIRKAYPQFWASIEQELPKEFSEWLASKLKI